MIEEYDFTGIYHKWAYIKRKKDVKKICRKYKIKMEDGLFFVYFYVDSDRNLTIKLAGFIEKNKDKLSFDINMLKHNKSIKVEDMPKCEFVILDYDLNNFVTYASNISSDINEEIKEVSDERLKFYETRSFSNLDEFRDYYKPDLLYVRVKEDSDDCVLVRIIGIKSDKIMGVIEDADNFSKELSEGDIVEITNKTKYLLITKVLKMKKTE